MKIPAFDKRDVRSIMNVSYCLMEAETVDNLHGDKYQLFHQHFWKFSR